LAQGPAVPLRAYLESHRTGDFTLDADNVYPGFERAVPPDSAKEPPQLRFVQPFTDPNLAFGPANKVAGNEYFHVLEIAPIDGGYRAYVCDGLYKVFREYEPGRYSPVVGRGKYDAANNEAASVRLWRVEFTDHPQPPIPDAPQAVTAPQKGQQPAPGGDVFGPWRITGASTGQWSVGEQTESASTDPQWNARLELCRDRMPDDQAARLGYFTGPRDKPPTTESAAPGWPGDIA
jgi:hypothetical protein